MKKGLIFILCLLVSACATEKTVFRQKSTEPIDEQPMLKGYTQQSLKDLFGQPIAQRTEEPHCLWTFRQSDCTLFVYFGKNQKARYSETRGKCIKLKEQLTQIAENKQKGN